MSILVVQYKNYVRHNTCLRLRTTLSQIMTKGSQHTIHENGTFRVLGDICQTCFKMVFYN